MVELTLKAYAELQLFFKANPEIYEMEKRELGEDPLVFPEQYLGGELREPAHAEFRRMVENQHGFVGPVALRTWMTEEEREGLEQTYPPPRPRTSICPQCHAQFVATGEEPSGLCTLCVHRRATWAAPRGARYPGSPFYPYDPHYSGGTSPLSTSRPLTTSERERYERYIKERPVTTSGRTEREILEEAEQKRRERDRHRP